MQQWLKKSVESRANKLKLGILNCFKLNAPPLYASKRGQHISLKGRTQNRVKTVHAFQHKMGFTERNNHMRLQYV